VIICTACPRFVESKKRLHTTVIIKTVILYQISIQFFFTFSSLLLHIISFHLKHPPLKSSWHTSSFTNPFLQGHIFLFSQLLSYLTSSPTISAPPLNHPPDMPLPSTNFLIRPSLQPLSWHSPPPSPLTGGILASTASSSWLQRALLRAMVTTPGCNPWMALMASCDMCGL